MAKKIFEDYIVKIVKQDPMFVSGPAFANQSQESYSPSFFDYKTEGNKSVVFPYWSPFYAINWLANRSHGILDNKLGCDYLFFQQLNGIYNFVPVSYFKNKEVVASYTRIPSDKTKDMMQYKNIQEFIVLSYADKMKDVTSGMYASSYKTLDITKKTIEIAKAMLLDGDSIEKISKITSLTVKEIEKLK
jgi:TfoX/Sxy family transcriptional regulator of competence genes